MHTVGVDNGVYCKEEDDHIQGEHDPLSVIMAYVPTAIEEAGTQRPEKYRHTRWVRIFIGDKGNYVTLKFHMKLERDRDCL